MDVVADVEIRDFSLEDSMRHRRMIDDFAQKNNLSANIVEGRGGKALIINNDSFVLEPGLIQSILDEYSRARKGKMTNNCYLLASAAVHKKVADGVIYTADGASGIVGWGNHAVNLRELSNGRVLAFDLTAGGNIDRRQGNYDVLIMMARSEKELHERMGELYGGDWSRQTSGDIEKKYKRGYPDSEEEFRRVLEETS